MEIIPPISSWSFSRLLDFEACPYRTYLRYVIKSPQPPEDEASPLVRGTRIHEEAELYLRNEGELTKALQKPLIAEHLDFCKEEYEAGNATVEEDWAFTEDWIPTAWVAKDAWLRLKLDVSVNMGPDHTQITDWKTGKSAGKEVRNMQQAQIYAAGVFMRNPKVEFVTPVFAYTDENKVLTLNPIKRHQSARSIRRFEERAKRLTTCIDFKAKPNKMNCKYCPFGPFGTQACAHGVE